MRITSAVVITVLLSFSISAKSTGSALVLKTNGYSSHTGIQESPVLLDDNAKRTLLQEPEDRCPRCPSLRQDFYDDSSGRWVLDDSALESSAVDIQCIVSCANASETIMLPTNGILKPSRTFTVNKPLTITGFHEGVPTSEGAYPLAENKAVISCPEGSQQRIFDIKSGGVTIANLQIRDCVLDEEDTPLVVGDCEENAEGVRIHHVDFVNNTHKSQLVAIDVPESSSCGTLEVTNVTFKDNRADDNLAIVHFGSSTLVRDVRIENNRRTENGTGKALLLITTSQTQSDKLTVDGLVARGNQMSILRAESSAIEILNSDVSGNDLRTHDASMLQFSSASEIVIRNCTFGNNTGTGTGMITSESVSSFEILESTFTGNSKFGSVVFSTGSELNIWSSNFTSNNGTSNGGIIHLENSTATITGALFEDNNSTENGGVIHLENSNAMITGALFEHNNSTKNGGSVFAIDNSALTIQNSTFMRNEAYAGGCLYVENSIVSIVGSTFHKNKANADGGAIRVEQGGFVCNDSVFEENSSEDEGGAMHIENAIYITMQSLNFTSREAAFGSVVRIDKSRTNVTLKNVHFHNGSVELTGAALYIDDSNIAIEDATFVNNTGPYGGAIYAQKFDITIKNAKFEKNFASVNGGSICGDNGNISVENTTFEENYSYLGGALHFYNATFNASEIVFLNNRASEGAGLMCKDSSVTIGPRSGSGPSIPSSAQVHQNSSFGIYARNNTGIDSGGVIDAKDSNVTISYGTFSANRASEGGAIQATSSELTFINIAHSWFEENIADARGGGVAIRSANEGSMSLDLSSTNFALCIAEEGGAVFLVSVNAAIQNCMFVNNTAMEGGAAFFRKNPRLIENNESETKSANISIDVKNSSFEGNVADEHGGAIMLRGELIVNRTFISSEEGSSAPVYAEKGFDVSLRYVNVSGSRAHRDGGGVYGEAVGLNIQNVEVANNNGTQGGGVYLMRSTTNISNSHIVSNKAESCGGGIMMARQSNGTIVGTNFTGNSISAEEGEGGGLSLSGSNVTANNLSFAQNNASSGGGVNLVAGSKRNSAVETTEVDAGFLCFDCTFSENNASISGGGLNIGSQDLGVLVVAQLEKCQFEDNHASVFGGGIHFVRPFDQTKCTTDWTSCSHLVILDSSFSNNNAERSGGSLMSNDRKRVLFSCSESADNTSSLEFINKTRATDLRKKIQSSDRFCPQWVGSRGIKENSSSLVSTYVRNCSIADVKDSNWSKIDSISGSIQINETVPGDRVPDIFIECYDEFGELAKSAVNGLTATLESKEENSLMGIFDTNLQDGTGEFTGVRNPPKDSFDGLYSYELEISFSLDYLKAIRVLVNVRGCRINEQKEKEGDRCKQCDAKEYNFEPMNGYCKPCDDSTLYCSETYVFPKNNFWHSSPCHVPAQKCLTANACNKTRDLIKKFNRTGFGNIETALKYFSCNFSNAFLETYQSTQCNEGYKGVLCGSCKEDYGRSLSLACTKCNGPAIGVFVLVSACVWLAAIAAITIRGSMSIEERLTVISKQLYDIAARARLKFEESIPDKAEIEQNEDKIDDESKKIIPHRRKAYRRTLAGTSRCTDASCCVDRNLPTTSVKTTVETHEEINNLKLAQLAKWKLCEVFKVTINFLQAISVAGVINVEWTAYMLTMFNTSAFVGGASTASVTRAIQCFPRWNGTKYATYAGLVSNILVPTFVILCIVAIFAVVAHKTSKGLYYFVKRSVLATLAICYFSYLSITKVAVMAFYCIGVHTGDFTSQQKTYRWALDTAIQCDDKGHIRLMVFGGILFVLFSVGFPLISAFALVHFRKGTESRDPQWMTDILGFLYRAYKREFVYWESTVMFRKALLSVIAVFSYPLGGHSQGVLASCILFVCIFFQSIYKPYRAEFETVNNIESLSLLISGITFNLAQFFTKDRTSKYAKVALAVFLMISIIGFLLYLMLHMLVCFIDVLRTDLRVIGALLDENENSWQIIGTWLISRLGLSKPPSGDDLLDDLKDMELGSKKSEKSADNMSDT